MEAREDRVAENLPQRLEHRLPRPHGELDNRLEVGLFVRTNLDHGAHGAAKVAVRRSMTLPRHEPSAGLRTLRAMHVPDRHGFPIRPQRPSAIRQRAMRCDAT
jgi:hypothetical protein